jgi:hypothetical protein
MCQSKCSCRTFNKQAVTSAIYWDNRVKQEKDIGTVSARRPVAFVLFSRLLQAADLSDIEASQALTVLWLEKSFLSELRSRIKRWNALKPTMAILSLFIPLNWPCSKGGRGFSQFVRHFSKAKSFLLLLVTCYLLSIDLCGLSNGAMNGLDQKTVRFILLVFSLRSSQLSLKPAR